MNYAVVSRFVVDVLRCKSNRN